MGAGTLLVLFVLPGRRRRKAAAEEAAATAPEQEPTRVG